MRALRVYTLSACVANPAILAEVLMVTQWLLLFQASRPSSKPEEGERVGSNTSLSKTSLGHVCSCLPELQALGSLVCVYLFSVVSEGSRRAAWVCCSRVTLMCPPYSPVQVFIAQLPSHQKGNHLIYLCWTYVSACPQGPLLTSRAPVGSQFSDILFCSVNCSVCSYSFFCHLVLQDTSVEALL